MDWAKTTARGYKKHLSLGIWCDLYYRFYGNKTLSPLGGRYNLAHDPKCYSLNYYDRCGSCRCRDLLSESWRVVLLQEFYDNIWKYIHIFSDFSTLWFHRLWKTVPNGSQRACIRHCQYHDSQWGIEMMSHNIHNSDAGLVFRKYHDFNKACGILSMRIWKHIAVFQKKSSHWLLTFFSLISTAIRFYRRCHPSSNAISIYKYLDICS